MVSKSEREEPAGKSDQAKGVRRGVPETRLMNPPVGKCCASSFPWTLTQVKNTRTKKAFLCLSLFSVEWV